MFSVGIGVNVAETVKALTELKHTPASPNSVRRMSATQPSIQQIQQTTTTTILSSFQSRNNNNPIYGTIKQTTNSTIYAQPSHLSSSPSTLRRTGSTRSQSAERKIGESPGSVGSGLIAALSAKLAPSLSPKNSRRHSEDLGPQSVANLQNKLSQKGPGQGFLDTLNAKLAQQQLNSAQGQLKANRIRQIINSKAQPDPKVCHESLMDQIRRGAPLKKARSVNDRSAPKIY